MGSPHLSRLAAEQLLEALGKVGRRTETHRVGNLRDGLVRVPEHDGGRLEAGDADQFDGRIPGEGLHLAVELHAGKADLGPDLLHTQAFVRNMLLDLGAETGQEVVLLGTGCAFPGFQIVFLIFR